MEDTPVKTAPIPSTSRALSEEADQGVTNNAPNFAENAVPCIALDSDEEEIDWDARPLSERLGMNLWLEMVVNLIATFLSFIYILHLWRISFRKHVKLSIDLQSLCVFVRLFLPQATDMNVCQKTSKLEQGDNSNG